MTDLAELLERVKAATGPDRDLNADLLRAFGWTKSISGRVANPDGSTCFTIPDLTASLDAALALVERVLPGSIWRIGFEPDADCYRAQIVTLEERVRAIRGEAGTAPLAVLAALLTAQNSVGSASLPKEA